jgi:signal transduction histidine kinase
MIPAELREKIFDKFFSTKTHKSGTGLGLSIVKTIIEEHNAQLDLESNEGLTTFVVTFKK